MTDGKIYISANALLSDSYRLGQLILDSSFAPTHLVGIWRGGAPVGIAVQELLEYHGQESDHIAIRTSSYMGIDKKRAGVRVYALGYLIDTLGPDDRLLLIDDVFDTGRSIEALIDELSQRCRYNMPKETRIATIYYKPSRNQTNIVPDYYVHETEQWLIFPHELIGLSEEEIAANKADADIILKAKI
jgi:hypoxanthine phosphoribosyltransferase